MEKTVGCSCVSISLKKVKVVDSAAQRADNEADRSLFEGSFLPAVEKKPQDPEISISRLPTFVCHHPSGVEQKSELQDYPEQVSRSVLSEKDDLLPLTQQQSRTIRRKKAQDNLLDGQCPASPVHVSDSTVKVQASLLDAKRPASRHVHFSDSVVELSSVKEKTKRENAKKGDHGKPSRNTGLQADHSTQPQYFSHKKIALKLREHVSNLFGSFYIINLQLPTDPVSVLSRDVLLEKSLARNEVTFLPNQNTDRTWILSQKLTDNGFSCLLTVHGDLFDRNCGDNKATHRSYGNGEATHRFVGQLDLTSLMADIKTSVTQITAEPIQDLWLRLAFQHLAHEGRCSSYPRKTFNVDTISAEDVDDAIIDTIRLLHEQYFMVGPSRYDRKKYVINHLAPSLKAFSALEHQNPSSGALIDLDGLGPLFERGEKFFARIPWKPSGLSQWLYCLPTCDQKFRLWLCFMIDGRFPDIWAKA